MMVRISKNSRYITKRKSVNRDYTNNEMKPYLGSQDKHSLFSIKQIQQKSLHKSSIIELNESPRKKLNGL